MRVKSTKKQWGEPTLPLINIVFLMLIFFLAAAQLARPLDPSFELSSLEDLKLISQPDALVLHADGTLWFRGQRERPEIIISKILAENKSNLNIRIIPDRRSEAQDVIDVAYRLREAGAHAIYLVSEREIQ